MKKEKLKFKIIFLVALLFCGVFGVVGESEAATYYVDYENGSDASDGMSTNAAWRHCPGDINATQNPVVALQPEDEIVFKGGVVYYGTININWTGSSEEQRIIYDGNSAGDWGVGRAIIDGENIRNFGFYTGSAKSYITIKNFEIRNIAHRLSGNSWDPVGGIYAYANATSTSIGWVVDDNYVHNVGYWNNDCANPLGSGVPTGAGIYLLRLRNSVISNNELTKTGNTGIGLANPVGVTISGNTIHSYLVWGIDISGDYGGATDNVIRGNTIYDLYQQDFGFRTGACDPHTDFIFIRQGDGVRPNRNIVEGNLFYNNYAFTDVGGTAQLFLSYADNTIIRNNIFINPHSYFAISIGWTSADTKVYNNTVYAPRATPVTINSSGLDTQIRNNILVGAGYHLNLNDDESQSSLAIVNNNLFIDKLSQVHKVTPYTNWTLPQWQALGFDADSFAVSDINMVGFQDISGYPENCEAMDLRLQSDSPAIDSGASLVSDFITDYEGIVRPQGSGWDIGAYEYQNAFRADVDGSLEITTTDALLTLRNSLGMDMTSTAWRASITTGDVDCSGVTNSTDALLILRYSIGMNMESTEWCE